MLGPDYYVPSLYYCIAVPQAQHNTAQSARTKPQRRYVPIRVRQRKQADKKTSAVFKYHKRSTAQRDQPAQSPKQVRAG